MKCNNCGCTEFIRFSDHYECACCGFPISSEPENISDEVSIGIDKEKESLTQSLVNILRSPRLNEQEAMENARRILVIEPANSIANFVVNYLGRSLYPENYKSFIESLIIKDDKLFEQEVILFLINNSEYKFFDAITNMLIKNGLYSSYNNNLFEAKKRLEYENDAFSNVPRDVFICYSSNDSAIVRSIVSKIENDGTSVWFAERNIPKNSMSISDYKLRIEDAISKCKIVLVIMSTNSMLSDDVKWELDIADKYNIINRIEYRIECVENSTRFKHFFDGILWIDASMESQETVLLGRIYEILHSENENQRIEDDSYDADELDDNYDNTDADSINASNNNVTSDIERTSDITKIDDITERTEYEEIPQQANRSKTIIKEAIGLFKQRKYEEAYNLLDTYDELPADTINLVYYYISYCFGNGFGTNIDEERKVYFWNLALTKGPYGDSDSLGECFFKMGQESFMYEYQKNVQQTNIISPYSNLYEGQSVFLLDKATHYGNAEAFAYIGLCYKYGLGVTKNEVLAFSFFREAMNNGSSEGAYQLGKCFEKGIGTPVNQSKSFECYKTAAEMGNSHAMVNVGVCYYYGRGIEQSFEFAAMYYQKAANLGNLVGMYNLARCCFSGKGVPQDIYYGNMWMQKAADKGYKPAQRYNNI